jgi:hypothetical protein
MDAQAQSRREALHALRLMHPHAASAAAVEALLPPPSVPLPALAASLAAAAGSAQLQVSREQAKQSLLAQAPRPQQFAAAFDALRARACVFLESAVPHSRPPLPVCLPLGPGLDSATLCAIHSCILIIFVFHPLVF